MKERLGVLIVAGMMLFISNQIIAQTHMRIHYKDGEHSDVPIEQIDSITFVNGDEGLAEICNGLVAHTRPSHRRPVRPRRLRDCRRSYSGFHPAILRRPGPST